MLTWYPGTCWPREWAGSCKPGCVRCPTPPHRHTFSTACFLSPKTSFSPGLQIAYPLSGWAATWPRPLTAGRPRWLIGSFQPVSTFLNTAFSSWVILVTSDFSFSASRVTLRCFSCILAVNVGRQRAWNCGAFTVGGTMGLRCYWTEASDRCSCAWGSRGWTFSYRILVLKAGR